MASKTPLQQVSAGGAHNLALTRHNGLYAFGAGSWGRLGLGSNSDKGIPTRVAAAAHLGPMRQVAAGHEHSLLLTAQLTRRRGSP